MWELSAQSFCDHKYCSLSLPSAVLAGYSLYPQISYDDLFGSQPTSQFIVVEPPRGKQNLELLLIDCFLMDFHQ